MDRLGACLAAGFHDSLGPKVALGRWRRTDVYGFVGHLDMQRFLVRIGIYGDALDSHAMRRADNSAGDFAAISDQDLREHKFPALQRNVAVLAPRIFQMFVQPRQRLT